MVSVAFNHRCVSKPVVELPRLPSKLKKKEFAASHATFVSALETGKGQLLENEDGFKFKDDPDSQLISISKARQMAVTLGCGTGQVQIISEVRFAQQY